MPERSVGRSWLRASKAERDALALVESVRRPLPGSRTLAVVAGKGGVGATTTTRLLGETLARYRGGGVVTVDATPRDGDLADRVARRARVTVADVVGDAGALGGEGRVLHFPDAAGEGLQVVASPTGADPAVGPDGLAAALALLANRAELVLVDCGAGVPDPAARRVLDAADGLVVVAGPTVAAARASGRLLDRLAADGRDELVADAVLVVNAVAARGPVDVDELERRFAGRVAATLRGPWDDALAAGGHVSLDELGPVTRDAHLRLAAATVARLA